MYKHLTRVLFAGAAFALSGMGPASAETSATPTLIAQASPAPKATATPNPFSYGGYIRSFYFTRLNNPQLTTKNPLNQASWNTGLSLHAAYNFGGGFTVGGAYLYADPLNGNCSTAASHAAGLPCIKPNTGAIIQGTNPDDTLPGFQLSTFYEAYLQYKNPELYVRLGNQVINTPWANASDSRLKPEAFQGGDLTYKFNKEWTGEAMFMSRFEDRVSSEFLDSTLLTATKIADAPGAGSNLHLANYSAIATSGFGYGRLGYTSGPLAANLHYYDFVDIANALWLDGKYTWKAYGKPFFAVQAGTEQNSGKAVIGKIDSQIFGMQAGYSPYSTVDLTVGFNYIPEKSDTLTLPAGVTCTGTSIGGPAVFSYFLPSGGTPQCHNNANGTATVYYGGWASPYTDSYATDQLFTTSISQGMIDRRSTGNAVKVSATAYTFQKRVKFIASDAWYWYGNGTAGVAPTSEFDLDGTFYFNAVGKGPYHGFSLRHRYAERTQPLFTTNPDFKYNRTQLEYDF
jgi:hypothetical protein